MIDDFLSGWNWDDADECTRRLDDVRAKSARCEKLELVLDQARYTSADLAEIGVTGIEFAEFKTQHPSGLGVDYIGLCSDTGETKPGRIYRVDDEAYFIQLDISEPLPFAEGSVDWAYAEHLIEHVSLKRGIAWLTEVHRILAPDGLLRLTTPDLRRYAESYLDDQGFFATHRNRVLTTLEPAPVMPARLAFMFNQIFYFYGHRWIYDADELRYALHCAGFDSGKMEVRGFHSGARADLAMLDREIREDETIYVEITS